MPNPSRLVVGVDVPWVTSWSGEAILGARPCATVNGGLAIFQQENPGVGRPNYSKNHVRRQRQMVREMLCPMCGQPTAQGDRWMQTATVTSAGALRLKGLGGALPRDVADERVVLNAGSIAPSHRACAERALEHCPHLRSLPSHELAAFPQRWAVYPLMVAAAAHALAKRPPPPAVMFLQLLGVDDAVDRGWRRRL